MDRFGYILKVGPVEFAYKLNTKSERKGGMRDECMVFWFCFFCLFIFWPAQPED